MRPHRGYSKAMQGQRLKELAKAAGFSELSNFARKAGIEPGTADKHVQRDRVPASAAALYIEAAEGTGADISWLLTGRGHAPVHVSEIVPSHVRVRHTAVTGTALDVTPPSSVRLWTIASRMPGGQVVIAESEEIVQAPGEFRYSKSAFAVQVWDDSCSPWLKRGTLLFVDRSRIPADGQWCIIAAESSNEGLTLYKPVLGLLRGIKEGSWELQLSAEVAILPVGEWPFAFLISYIRPT